MIEAGSSDCPLSSIEDTDPAISSMNVEAPGSVHAKVTRVVEANSVSPVVRSHSTVYEPTDSRRARSAASALVRLLPVTGCGLLVVDAVRSPSSGSVLLVRFPVAHWVATQPR